MTIHEIIEMLKPYDTDIFTGEDLSAKTGKKYAYKTQFWVDLRNMGTGIEFCISSSNGSLAVDFPRAGGCYLPEDILKASRAGGWLLENGWRIAEQSIADSRCFLIPCKHYV